MAFDGSLGTWVSNQRGLLSLQQDASLVYKVADILQQGHNQQRMHLDVNPFSILIHTDGQNIDQFAVRMAEPSHAAHASAFLSRSCPANSLLLYMAPEQWVGRPPFQGPPTHLMDLHLNVQPPAAGTLNQQVSPALDTVILSALAKRPEDRYPSISSFAHALAQAIQHPESVIVSVPRTTLDG